MFKITKYSEQTFESIKKVNEYGAEYWLGRELAKILKYSRWSNFLKVIEKAKETCINSGFQIFDHIADVGNMIDIGKGGSCNKNRNRPRQ